MTEKMIKKIINIANTTSLRGEPEIDINNNDNISLYDYVEDEGQAYYVIDICKVDEIDIEKLRCELDRNGIYYVM